MVRCRRMVAGPGVRTLTPWRRAELRAWVATGTGGVFIWFLSLGVEALRVRSRFRGCRTVAHKRAASSQGGLFGGVAPGAPAAAFHDRAHETGRNLVCRLLLEKKK